jgi:phosphoribosyl 1,2-cyclic phosphodiesterase
MPLVFQSLASGSKGNAVVVCSHRTSILLDSGLSARELVSRLEQTPVRPKQLDAVVISHEHTDHVRGLGTLSRRFDIPVYLTQGTLENLPSQIGRLADIRLFQAGVPFAVGDVRISPFALSHDAKDPAGFVLEHGTQRLGICTDLGMVTQLVRTRLQGCQGLILEANHDPDLLLSGPYPLPLKQRIRGRHGHLSNAESYDLLRSIHHDNLQVIMFAHLSEINNTPTLVLDGFKASLNDERWQGVAVEVGRQNQVSKAFTLI